MYESRSLSEIAPRSYRFITRATICGVNIRISRALAVYSSPVRCNRSAMLKMWWISASSRCSKHHCTPCWKSLRSVGPQPGVDKLYEGTGNTGFPLGMTDESIG